MFRDPGLFDFIAGFRDFPIPSSQVLHSPALRSAAPLTPLLPEIFQIRDVLQARRPPEVCSPESSYPEAVTNSQPRPTQAAGRPRPCPGAQSRMPLQIPPSRDPPQTGTARNWPPFPLGAGAEAARGSAEKGAGSEFEGHRVRRAVLTIGVCCLPSNAAVSVRSGTPHPKQFCQDCILKP